MPLPRLLGLHHRTLDAADARLVSRHVGTCPQCRTVLTTIELTVTLFQTSNSWRRTCPSTLDLFRHSGAELVGSELTRMTDHLPACSACREELLVFRDVRQSARKGHSTFLDPENPRLIKGFERTISWWRRLRTFRIRGAGSALRPLLWAAGGFTLLGGVALVVLLRGGRTEQTNESTSALPPGPATAAPVSDVKQVYVWMYDETGFLQARDNEAPESAWAAWHLRPENRDPAALRIGEPLGPSGMVVLQSRRTLNNAERTLVRSRVVAALAGPARTQSASWGTIRSELSSELNAEVFLTALPHTEIPDHQNVAVPVNPPGPAPLPR